MKKVGMMENKLNILVTNDDGISSPGLFSLVKVMKNIGNVTVVAPDRQQSAVSSSLTIQKPLRVNHFYFEGNKFGYMVDGSPADCVKLAVTTLLPTKPDLIVSGINHGKNTSINVLYSGTVAAAIEGMLFNIPSIAFSVSSHRLNVNLETSEYYIDKIIPIIMKIQNKESLLINVNIPAIEKEEIKGIKVTKLSDSRWNDKYEKRVDPFGYEYYWFAGTFETSNSPTDTDDGAINDGYISVTPIKIDYLHNDLYKKLNLVKFDN